MTIQELNVHFNQFLQYIHSAKLKFAFDKLQLLSAELQVGAYVDRLNDMEQNYRYMLQYFVEGLNDPQRNEMYNKIVARMLSLGYELNDQLHYSMSTQFDYVQRRYFPHKKRFSQTSGLWDALKYYHLQKKMNEGDNDGNALLRLRMNYESLLPDVFSIYWLTPNYSDEELGLLKQMKTNEFNNETLLAVSGITLNVWRMWDDKKVMLLLDLCDDENVEVRLRAMVALCFVITKYDKLLKYYPAISNRLVLLTDNEKSLDMMTNIIFQIIGTADTEEITRKMREEILPEVMKISPMLKDKLEADNLTKADEWDEENPQWQDILEQSGVSDKLQELSELQLEGADVYMSTFSILKNFSFFNEISNWLLPFDTAHSQVHALFAGADPNVLSAFVGNNAMCNSDKYSFCLSVLQMPAQQRSMLTHSFKMEAEQLKEMANDEAILQPNVLARTLSKQYVQDLFRFFKLFPQKEAFGDVFDYALKIHKTQFFSLLAKDNDLVTRVADFYFSKGHYAHAIQLFELIEGHRSTEAAFYQRLGFAYQRISDLKNALAAYQKADILQPDDLWTTKKLALCYRLKGDYGRALDFYQHADFLKPKQQTTQMRIAQCLVELGRYKKALDYYTALDSDNADSQKVWSAIVWCALLAGQLAQAEYYSDKVLENKPMLQDYLNAGHIAFCLKKYNKALEYYTIALSMCKNEVEFWGYIDNDAKYFEAYNSDRSLLLLMDQLFYKR